MKKLLKFMTCGSVDDGKSTLIGHMLYDTKLLFTDQIKSLEMEKKLNSNGDIDYSLVLDGLMAEREQKITIDVAYRYFSTDKRSFIVADTPGHEQYTRNMAVGASFAELAVILIDATKGILLQTRRHSYICNLMGIKNFVFVINKMDVVNYDEVVYQKLLKEIKKLAIDLDLENIEIIPTSATKGDNLTRTSENMPWYQGMSLLDYLESVDVEDEKEANEFILPIQRVCRPDRNFRGFQGQIASGKINIDDEIEVLPSKEKAKIQKIFLGDREAEEAIKNDPVTVCLDREIDISRGNVITKNAELKVNNLFVATILWMDDCKLMQGQNFWLKLGTKLIPATIMSIKYKIDINSTERIAASELKKNELASCEVILSENIAYSSFAKNRALGRFILIDRVTNMTSACGIIKHSLRRSENVTWQNLDITREVRAKSLGQQPLTIWFTGLSGAGKSTLANGLEKILNAQAKHTMLLDGDNLRLGLNCNLGFREPDRVENIRRIAEVAKLMNDAGLIVIVACISPRLNDRERAKQIIGENNFVEIYVNTPLSVCEQRDVKGLYKKARNKEIPNFTGISSPYEEPLAADIVIDTSRKDIDESVNEILSKINVSIQMKNE